MDTSEHRSQVDIGDLQVRQAMSRAGIAASGEPGGYVIAGPRGSGKSTALRGIGKQFDGRALQLDGLQREPQWVFGRLIDDSRDENDLRWTLSKRIRSAGYDALVIDDAHRLDAGSSAVVHALVVNEGLSVCIAYSTDVRDEPDPATIALWKDGHLPRHDLRPLESTDVAEYLRSVLGGEPALHDVEQLHWWSGGDAAVLVELVAETLRDGCWSLGETAVLEGRPQCSAVMLDLLRRRIPTVSDEVMGVLEVLTAAACAVDDHTLGWLPLAAVLRVCDLDAMIETERLGLIDVDDTSVRLNARYVGDWVADRVPSLRLRMLAGRLAEAIDHLPVTTLGGDQAVAVTGLLGLAAPGTVSQDSLTAAAISALRLGDPETVLTIATQGGADPLVLRGGSETAAVAAWSALHLGRTNAFAAMLETRTDDQSAPWRGLRSFVTTGLELIAGPPIAVAEAPLPVTTVVDIAELVDADRLSGAWQGLVVAGTATMRGRPRTAREILRVAAPAADDDGLLSFYLTLLEVLLEGATEDCGAACELAESARARFDWHSDHARAAADFACATAYLPVGRFDEAVRLLGNGIPFLASEAWQIAATRLLGRLSLEQTGRSSVTAPAFVSQPMSRPLEIAADALDAAWRSATSGAVEDAIGHLLDTFDLLVGPAPLLTVDHVELAARFATPPLAGETTRRVTRATGRLMNMDEVPPRVLVIRSYVTALSDGDGPLLERASADFLSLGRIPAAADVAAQAAIAFEASGQPRRAAASRLTAARLVASVGGLASPAQRRLESAGGLLTERERQVVELIADGASNRQAAGRLGLSVRTVEGHLLRACAKVGARSRKDVADYWLEQRQLQS